MKLTFILGLIFCSFLLASAGTKKTTKKAKLSTWLQIYWKLLDIFDSDTDLVHVMDSSGSLEPIDFKYAKKAAKKITKVLHIEATIGPGLSRVGLVKFSSVPLTVHVFHLGEFVFIGDILSAIGPPGGVAFDNGPRTAIGNGLALARQQFLAHVADDVPPKNKRVVWLYTDGKNNQGLNPILQAHILKTYYKAIICVVGIGQNVNEAMLKQIASRKCYFHVKSFKHYLVAMRKVLQKVRKRSSKRA